MILQGHNTKALDCKIYPITPTEDEALQKFLKDMQAKGYIRLSNPHTHHLSFLFKRKTESYDLFKIITNSMNSRSGTNNPFH
jgi:hypothetical protein